ncbi:MAG: hypothetical protein M3357_11570 [Actinomycetota bacterium]|nr:hypothetical protein [Actinomycetota bacterium]
MEERDLARPAPDLADDGVPATEEVRDELLHTGDPGVGEMPAPDRPWGAEDWGTTDFEQREGEPLDVRLRREEPDGEPRPDGGGRLLEPGTDDGRWDTEADAVGELDLSHSDGLSPEEAAMTVREDPGGLNYDDSPGYLQDESE